jgi:hypothetical protein
MRPRAAAELGLALAIFAAGAWLYLGRSIPSLAGHLGPDLGDPRLNLYFVSWAAHLFERGDLGGLWSPPFFHPTPGALAFSDHLIGPGFAAWLLGLAGVGRVTAFNLLFLASFVLTGVVAFAVFRRLGLAVWSALLGGWFVAFSQLRWDEISHYQVLRAQWIPAVLWSFDRLLAAPAGRRAAVFLVFYLLHVSGGTYLAYMIHVPLAVIAVVRLREHGWRTLLSRSRLPWLAGAAVAALALLAPFVAGYVAEWGSVTIGRQLWEVRSSGATLASFGTPADGALVRRLGPFADYAGRGALFPGLVLLAGCAAWLALRRTGAAAGLCWRRIALAAVAAGVVVWALHLADAFTLSQREAGWLAALGLRRYNGPRVLALLGLAASWWALRGVRRAAPRPRDPFVVALAASGALALWLSLPVGFTSVYHYLPGMSGMRVAHRFFVFTLLAVAFLGARGLELATRRIGSPSLRATVVAALAVAAAAESTPPRWRWSPVPERSEQFPAYARFLAATSSVRAYVEAPMLEDYRETERMHAQTLHWKPMVNGYSARFAASYRRQAEAFAPLPDAAGWRRLREIGVTHLVVHRHESRPGGKRPNRELFLAAAAAERRGELVAEFAEPKRTVVVYRIAEPAPEGASP